MTKTDDNTNKLTNLVNNFRPVRWKKYQKRKDEIKEKKAEIAQLENRPLPETQPQQKKFKAFRTVRKTTHNKRREELDESNRKLATLKEARTAESEQPNNTKTVASSSNTTNAASTQTTQEPEQEREREREREKVKPKLKIDPTLSTSTTSWLNTSTPKNDKKFSFHSKENTEETIVGESSEEDEIEEIFYPETKNKKNKQKQIEPELSTENQNPEDLITENDKLKNNTLWLANQIKILADARNNALTERNEKENQRRAAIVAQTNAEADRDQTRQSLDRSLQRQITLTSYLIARANQVCDLEAEKNNLETTAQTYYNYAEPEIQRLETQFANSKYNYDNLLDEIESAFDELEARQKEIKDLQAQAFQSNYENETLQNKINQKEIGLLSLFNQCSALKNELNELKSQQNTSSLENSFSNSLPTPQSTPNPNLVDYWGESDSETEEIFRPRASTSQSSQNKGKNKEKFTWEEEIEQLENSTILEENSLAQSSKIHSYSESKNSISNLDLLTLLQKSWQLETFSEIEKFENLFEARQNFKTKSKRQWTETEKNLIFQINLSLDWKKKQSNQILTELEEKCLFELGIDFRSLDDFWQDLQHTKFSEIPELWNQTYQKILTNRPEHRKQKVKFLTAQLRQISEASAEVAASLVKNPASPRRPTFQTLNNNKLYDLENQETPIIKGYRKRLKEAINNQVKKTQNYLGESYRNHPRTYQAIGLTALGAGVAYNWETLTEYLNPQQVQGALTSLSNYSSQAAATISSTALTFLPSLNFNLNKPNQVENNLNLNWTNQTSSFNPQLPNFYEQILNGNCPANLTVDNQNLNKSNRTSPANTHSNIKDKKQKKNCQKNRSTSQNSNTFFNERSWLVNQNPSLENFEATELVRHDTHPKISELSESNEVSQALPEPVSNKSFSLPIENRNQAIVPVNSATLNYWNTLKNFTVNQNWHWPNLTALGSGFQWPFYGQRPSNPLEKWFIKRPFHQEEILTNLTSNSSQNSLELINNNPLTAQQQKLNELEQNLFNLGIPANEINNISDRKILFKYHPDKALINGLSAEKANEIFKNLSAYRSQLENFTSEAPNLLENSASQQPDKLMNESQINSSPNGNQTETQQNSIPLNTNNILGGTILIVGAGQLLAKYEAKQQENQTREKAAVKIQSLVRMHQTQQEFKREKERLAQEKATRESERNNQGQFFQSNYSSPSTPPTNSHEEKTPSQNDNNVPSPGSETNTPTYSAPGGGDYSGGWTTTAQNFSEFPSQIIQDILNQAQKAIQSQQIPQLETAEKKITSLFEEKDASKKQIYYSYQPQLEEKLAKVVQTKTIQEIKINHLDIAQQIKATIEPQKLQGKEWKEVISNTIIEKIPAYKKQIQSDILRQTKQAATESLESDLKLAQLIKRDIQPEENWKLTIKNASQEKEIKKVWAENKQNLLTQSQEAVINNLNSLLGSELKIEDLDQPFSEFASEVYQKKLAALKAYQHQVAEHIAEKKRNYSQMAQLNTVARPESKWKNWILPLTVGGVGVAAGVLALKHWLNSPKAVNKNSPPISHPSTKIKLLIERYLTNLKKLQKNGYNAKLAQNVQEDFRQIQVSMEELLSKQKNKFEEKNWDDFQRKYREYSKN